MIVCYKSVIRVYMHVCHSILCSDAPGKITAKLTVHLVFYLMLSVNLYYCLDAVGVQCCVLMEPSGWWEAAVSERAGWRCASMRPGVPCVTTAGSTLMPAWSADNWASLELVRGTSSNLFRYIHLILYVIHQCWRHEQHCKSVLAAN